MFFNGVHRVIVLEYQCVADLVYVAQLFAVDVNTGVFNVDIRTAGAVIEFGNVVTGELAVDAISAVVVVVSVIVTALVLFAVVLAVTLIFDVAVALVPLTGFIDVATLELGGHVAAGVLEFGTCLRVYCACRRGNGSRYNQDC